ncbi:MAG: lipoprotein signal peptidase [Bacteroidales bacterium]|nr:lipoprotein signal peptidase [Bacteroidales bacterium]
MKKNAIIASSVIFIVLLLDQIVKIWVKTHMMLGEEFSVFGEWFRIHFVENNGMAFGMELSGNIGKILLSGFRIIAVVVIGWFLVGLCKKSTDKLLITCIALVWAGAVGNIIDSVFYGVIFDSSWGQIAQLLPENGGYSTWLHGRVVDMFYFPLIDGRFPEWMPIWGGEEFIFFRPVFNCADAAISVGIVLLLIFRHEELSKSISAEKSREKSLE